MTVGQEGYLLRSPDKRGLALRAVPFVVEPGPLRGECLAGLVRRCLAANGFTSPYDAQRLADLRVSTLNSGDLSEDEVGRLACFLRLAPEQVSSRLYPTSMLPHGEFVDFHGVRIRKRYVDSATRRVSPRALAISPHSRAVHALRPLSFCVETEEMLIDRCPVCAKPLRWTSGRWIATHCAFCLDEDERPTVDFRDHPQPLVEVEGMDALRLMSRLVSPLPETREKALRCVDPSIRHLPPGEIFELGMLFVRVLAADPASGTGRWPAFDPRMTSSGALTPATMAKAGRVLANVKRGFGEIADDMRTFSDQRSREAGIFKELGPLAAVGVASYQPHFLSQGTINLLADIRDQDLRRTEMAVDAPLRRGKFRARTDLVTAQEAVEILHTKHGRLMGLRGHGVSFVEKGGIRTTLFQRSEIEAIAVVLADMIPGTKAARRVGLPLHLLEALADRGKIERADGPALQLAAPGTYFRIGSIDAYIARVAAALAPGKATRTRISLPRAVRILRLPAAAMLDVAEAIEAGTVLAEDPGGDRGIFARMRIDPADLQRFEIGGAALPADDAMLSYREAALHLNVPEPTISWLVAAGLLQPEPGDRRMSFGLIKQFGSRYAMSSEVASHLGVSTVVLARDLRAKGIHPVCALWKGYRFVWERAEIQAVSGRAFV